MSFYDPNFEDAAEAFWFEHVRACVHMGPVTFHLVIPVLLLEEEEESHFAYSQERLEIGS